ncbi:MAG: tRNA uridine-5-carboxymethylaminomethyl(34) synthesis GTPase MnmE [Synergistaceae bacterium]|nr:tRNA uridine-5-carboxymethylaminomethyl(34) synthesis GTPase MnmE [Synergistaceae bacterium]
MDYDLKKAAARESIDNRNTSRRESDSMEDIITALATSWGEGGIAVVRLSGEGSVALADKLFSGQKKLADHPARFLTLGRLRSSEGIFFDEVLAVRFDKGASYTAEESVEIHCHGGLLPAQKCIEELCLMGARLAQPGEFTRRAFVNGRIDLPQAEAVLGVIRAESDEALYASSRTLQGAFAEKLRAFLDGITGLAAFLEVDLDFPEEDEGYIAKADSVKRLEDLISAGETLLADCRSGLILREGIRAAIIGRPNVGKSSLLNALLKEERAIVTSVPGTTRDRIEETLTHKGIPIRIIDTAGIRETKDEIEHIGVNQSIKSMTEADIRVWVIDAGDDLTEQDMALGKMVSSMKHIIVLNKSDIPQKISLDHLKKNFPSSRIVSVSALKSAGVEDLKDLIVCEITGDRKISGGYGVTSRQIECLSAAHRTRRDTENCF